MPKEWQPTLHLRIFKKLDLSEKLQQLHWNPCGGHKWFDVPIVSEHLPHQHPTHQTDNTL